MMESGLDLNPSYGFVLIAFKVYQLVLNVVYIKW